MRLSLGIFFLWVAGVLLYVAFRGGSGLGKPSDALKLLKDALKKLKNSGGQGEGKTGENGNDNGGNGGGGSGEDTGPDTGPEVGAPDVEPALPDLVPAI